MISNRIDANQTEIVKTIRAIGATVQLLNAVKNGCPDILVGFRGVNYLFEIKTPKGRLTEDEVTWHDCWMGQKAIVKTADEIMRIIGAM